MERHFLQIHVHVDQNSPMISEVEEIIFKRSVRLHIVLQIKFIINIINKILS